MDDVKNTPQESENSQDKKGWQTPSLKEVDVSKSTAGGAACTSGNVPGAPCTAGTGPVAAD